MNSEKLNTLWFKESEMHNGVEHPILSTQWLPFIKIWEM